MFFIVASLIALLTLAYLVASGFVRVVRYFWGWLSSGEKIDGLPPDASSAVSDAPDDAPDAAPDAAPAAPFSKPKPTQAELSAYLDKMHLGWYQVVILFIVGCMAGLLIEEIWMLITAGLTESRVGLIWGPFSPLYGTGSVFLTVICYQLHKHHANNLVIFLVSVVVGGTLEQLTGWGMQEIFHSESWTYAHLPDAITQ
ncbi:MAG: putative ABC transporter permease, partial [Atopobium sp.]|nr:putative ABC transporter permease [Atopobium sp.]